MAKPTTRFVCQSCGAVTPKWAGRCETCGEWNTIVEEADRRRAPAPAAKAGRRPARRASSAWRARRAAAALPDRHRGTRPRAGRRPGARPRPCWSAAIPASANPPCCCRPPPRLARAGQARALHLRRGSRSSRSACAPAGWASPTRRSNSPPRSTCATSPPAWRRPATPRWW